MIRHAVLEHVAPGIGERPEHRRHMGADRLALRARRALAGAAVEFGQHLLVRDRGRLHVADARAHGSSWARFCADYAAGEKSVQWPWFGPQFGMAECRENRL